MKSATIFREYIWLVNTIHRHQRLTFEVLSPQWLADIVKQAHLDAIARYE